MMVLLYCPIFIKMITFAKHFILIISFNLHNNTVTKIRTAISAGDANAAGPRNTL